MTETTGTNGATAPPRDRRPFLLGAVVGAVVAAVVATLLVLVLTDGDGDSGASSSNTTSSTAAPPSTSSPASTTIIPPTTTTRRANLPPPVINGFGVSLQNCPQGASSTTVNVSYSTRNAQEVQFAIDDEVVHSTTQLSGSEDVGPLPCDGEQHTLTIIAISDGLRATQESTLSVS
jgi:hypothetical protein